MFVHIQISEHMHEHKLAVSFQDKCANAQSIRGLIDVASLSGCTAGDFHAAGLIQRKCAGFFLCAYSFGGSGMFFYKNDAAVFNGPFLMAKVNPELNHRC